MPLYPKCRVFRSCYHVHQTSPTHGHPFPASHCLGALLFLLCFLLLPSLSLLCLHPLCLLLLLSAIPSSHGLVQSTGHVQSTVYCFLSLPWSLPDASGCAFPHIYTKTTNQPNKQTLPLKHTLKWSCPWFMYLVLKSPRV